MIGSPLRYSVGSRGQLTCLRVVNCCTPQLVGGSEEWRERREAGDEERGRGGAGDKVVAVRTNCVSLKLISDQ